MRLFAGLLQNKECVEDLILQIRSDHHQIDLFHFPDLEIAAPDPEIFPLVLDLAGSTNPVITSELFSEGKSFLTLLPMTSFCFSFQRFSACRLKNSTKPRLLQVITL